MSGMTCVLMLLSLALCFPIALAMIQAFDWLESRTHLPGCWCPRCPQHKRGDGDV